jgi:hypothetical protein
VSHPHNASRAALAARQLVRDMLSAPEDACVEVPDGNADARDRIAYLLTEGVIVRERDAEAGAVLHRIVAPMVVPLLMRDIGSNALCARLPRLPLPVRPDNTVNTQQSVLELLPFLNLDAVYHPFALRKNGQPCEYAYHFQLFDLMAHRASDAGWRVLGETRNAAAGGPLRLLSLLIASNGRRCGIALLVDGDELDKHLHEQADTYRRQQGLASVLVLNFASTRNGIADRLRAAPPDGIELLQVQVDRAAATLTPYKLGDDGCTSVALASVSPGRAIAGPERFVAPLAALSVAPVAPARAVCNGLEFGLEPASTVNGLLAAIARHFDVAADTVKLWRVVAGACGWPGTAGYQRPTRFPSAGVSSSRFTAGAAPGWRASGGPRAGVM